MVNSVTFPISLGGDGSTVTDDNNPTTGLGQNGHRTRFVPCLSQTVVMAQTAATAAQTATDQALIATQQATIATGNATALLGTSTTSNTPGTGSKSFTTQPNKSFAFGQFVTIVHTADANNWLFGQVTSWVAGTGAMTVNVIAANGTGPQTSWNISVSGIRGATGAAGTQLRYGAGAPASLVGNDGDFYIDSNSPYNFYGPKAAGAWPASTFSLLIGSFSTGDAVHSVKKVASTITARGAKYLKTAYAALSRVVGNLYDNALVSANWTVPATYFPVASQCFLASCIDSSKKFSYRVHKNVAAPTTSGDCILNLCTNGTTLTSLGNILAASTDYVCDIASNESYIVALCRNSAGTSYYLRYAALLSNGQLSGGWTNVTPAGLTGHANGFGVINEQFWLAYNVGGVATSPRLANGNNPSALSVTTPTGSSPSNQHSGAGCLMFFDGVNYNWITGSSQLITGTSLSAMARNSAVTPGGIPQNYLSTYSQLPSKPWYSADGSKATWYLSQQRIVKDFGATGDYATLFRDRDASQGFAGAAFVGEELYGIYQSGATYYLGRADPGTGDILGTSLTLASGCLGVYPLGTGLMVAESSTPNMGFFRGCSYDISTTFAAPNMPSPWGDFQVKV